VCIDFVLFIYKIWTDSLEREVDKSNITPTDFTILMEINDFELRNNNEE